MRNVRRVKSLLASLIIISICALAYTGCTEQKTSVEKENKDGLKIIASISIIADIAENICGQRGSVEFLVPVDHNPEDFELLPSDIKKVNDADVLFINGWGLEEMMEKSLASVTATPIFQVTGGIDPLPLVGEDIPDPHAWLDVQLVKTYVDNILNALTELDPESADQYRQNAAAYQSQLAELHGWIKKEINRIPEKNRIIVISENAFKYFGEAYGLQAEGLWELNSHEEGTPQQIARIVNLVQEKELPALFVETTVDKRYMETVSRETGIPIAGKIYTDALGPPGSGAETYIKMMKYNVQSLTQALSRKLSSDK